MQWELNYEEASLHAELEVNPVAKTCLYLKSSQLGQRRPATTSCYRLTPTCGDSRRSAPCSFGWLTAMLNNLEFSMKKLDSRPNLEFSMKKLDSRPTMETMWSLLHGAM